MKYVVNVNGTRVVVELDGGYATIDGERMAVALAAVAGTPIQLVRVGDQLHRVLARRGDRRGAWTLDVDGVRYLADAMDERMRTLRDLTELASASSGPAPLVAPMPGLVVRVSVSVGDEVMTGQALVTVEAMKMENELRAGSAGVVMRIHAVPGTAVEKGAVLIELGPVAAP